MLSLDTVSYFILEMSFFNSGNADVISKFAKDSFRKNVYMVAHSAIPKKTNEAVPMATTKNRKIKRFMPITRIHAILINNGGNFNIDLA